ncbi:cytochrome c biogenesis protein ResB [Streptomyces griseoaurantiacus]|uniref:cytochrome c biogenesis protein ResB n=1 Tax=Streptomyces griseoaurantiacus TaxID=68213 RepID=UPI00369C4389
MSESTTTDAAREAADAAGEDQDLGAAGSQLSTAPTDTVVPGSFGGVRGPGAKGSLTWTLREITGWARWFWRQLTSMRVALILLFMLSLGAIPGSLIPQTGADALKVESFKAAHKTLGPLYERLGLFHVYSSVWFSAIYILLFVSLIGCIVPRTWQFVGQLRSRPPGAPRRLTRLPAYATWRTDAEPEAVRAAALRALRRRRFRAHVAGDAVAAEKGYVRELGNLLFHIALIVLLVAFAWGQLYKSDGDKLVIEGDGFANTPTQYDDIKSGSLFSSDDLVPFSFDLHRFTGTYERTGPNRGTPRTYEAALSYREGADGARKKTTVRVNHPLHIGDSKVYLVSHGYAPVVTVRDAKGKVVFHQAVPLLPSDANVTSQGAIKVLDGYTNAKGEREQLGFSAFFVPTFAGAGKGTMVSQFPALDNPVLALTAYHGSLGSDSGIPQNVYQLDTSHAKQFKTADGEIFKDRLAPGQTMKLPGGNGSITFEKDIKEWAGFQIVQEPGSVWALTGAVTAILGLAASLFISRRRVWVRAVRDAEGVTVVEMAGLGRGESAKLPQELGDLAARVHAEAPTRTGPPGQGTAAGGQNSHAPDDAGTSPGEQDAADPTVSATEGAEKQ